MSNPLSPATATSHAVRAANMDAEADRPASRAAEPHMPQLDGVRCFAAVAVVAEHVFLGRYVKLGMNGIGVHAVWVFFTLSGFLITGILLRSRDSAPSVSSALRSFYARRFLRIMPVYYAVLLVAFIFGVGATFRQDVFWHLTYMSNWLLAVRGRWIGYAEGPLWSLGVEEQFYLIWPTMVLFAPRKRLATMFIVAAVIGIVSRLVLAVAMLNHGASVTVITPSPSNLDPLALGALLAWHRYAHPQAVEARLRWTSRALLMGLVLLAIIVALSVLGRGSRVMLVVETFATALMSVWLIDRASTGFARGTIGERVLNAPVARYLGTISYGIYIIHGPVRWAYAQTPVLPMLARRGTLAAAFAYFVIILATTVAIASLSWFGFEKPINGLKRYFPYSGKRSGAVPRRRAGDDTIVEETLPRLSVPSVELSGSRSL